MTQGRLDSSLINLLIYICTVLFLRFCIEISYVLNYDISLFLLFFIAFIYIYLFKKDPILTFSIYISSIYILGQFSIYSGFSFRSIITVLLIALLFYYSRLKIKDLYLTIPIILFLFFGTLPLLLGNSNPFTFHSYIDRAFDYSKFWISSFILGYGFIRNPKDFTRFIIVFSYTTFILVLSFPFSYLSVLIDSFNSSRQIYLTLGNINRSEVSFIFSIGLGFFLYHYSKGKKFLEYPIIFYLLLILLAGSKAPLLISLLLLLLTSFILLREHLYLRFSLIIIIFHITLIAIFFIPSFNINFLQSDHSFTTREALISSSIDEIQSSNSITTRLIGYGLGTSVFKLDSLGSISGLKAASSNLIVDVLYENGVLGLILLIIILSPNILVMKYYFYPSLFVFLILFTKISLSTETYNEYLLLIFTGINTHLLVNRIRSKCQ